MLAANNEVGTLLDLGSACVAARGAGASVVIDASQAAGKVPINVTELGCDHLVLSGAKLYGPHGAAALVSRHSLQDARRARFGTPDLPAAAALGAACRLRQLEMAVDEPRIELLRDALQTRLEAEFPDLQVNGDREGRLAGTLHFAAPGVPSDAILNRVHGRLAISSGAACHSLAVEPSHVLVAMGLPGWVLDGAIRVSLGRFNTQAEVDSAGDLLVAAIKATRAAQYRRSA